MPYARWGLVYIPALYSLGAFLIYFVRRRWLAPAEDRRRLARNIRRLLLREAFFGRTVDCKALFAEASSFPVPTDDVPAWQLTVYCRLPTIDYRAVFDVPIFPPNTEYAVGDGTVVTCS